MKKLVALSLIAASTLGLAACGEKPAENATANEVVVTDNLGEDANVTETGGNEIVAPANESSNATN